MFLLYNICTSMPNKYKNNKCGRSLRDEMIINCKR